MFRFLDNLTHGSRGQRPPDYTNYADVINRPSLKNRIFGFLEGSAVLFAGRAGTRSSIDESKYEAGSSYYGDESFYNHRTHRWDDGMDPHGIYSYDGEPD